VYIFQAKYVPDEIRIVETPHFPGFRWSRLVTRRSPTTALAPGWPMTGRSTFRAYTVRKVFLIKLEFLALRESGAAAAHDA
jgi:hypothetical protein